MKVINMGLSARQKKRAIKLVIVLCIISLLTLSVIFIISDEPSKDSSPPPENVHDAAVLVQNNYDENRDEIVVLNGKITDLKSKKMSATDLSNRNVVEIVGSLMGLIIGLFCSTSIFYKLGKKDLFN